MASVGEPMVRRPLCPVRRVGVQLQLSGEIDDSNAAELSARVVAEIGAGVTDVDLSRVRFFSAAGAGLLVVAARAATVRQRMVRVAASPAVMRVVEVCGLDALDGLWLTATGPA
ncbi:MAG TPA: STAS domain-containing protein [Rugosimonospora sp.]|nr:STAS domain-containing protein [Rugosimonospora sp.]